MKSKILGRFLIYKKHIRKNSKMMYMSVFITSLISRNSKLGSSDFIRNMWKKRLKIRTKLGTATCIESMPINEDILRIMLTIWDLCFKKIKMSTKKRTKRLWTRMLSCFLRSMSRERSATILHKRLKLTKSKSNSIQKEQMITWMAWLINNFKTS